MEAYVLDWVNPAAALGPRHRGDRLDRLLVLFRLSRQQPDEAERARSGREGRRRRTLGRAWRRLLPPAEVHGGAQVAAAHLHWFYWESYSTWLTGFALFTVLYLYQAGAFLIDRNLYAWSPAGAIAAALGFLVVFWAVYGGICRTFGQRGR